MKALYDWIKEFVDVDLPAEEVRARLSLAGIAVEGVAATPAGPLLDVDLTINRPDCLGHYGMAREVAALVRGRLRPLAVELAESTEPVAGATRVEIESPELCGRYTARILRGVKVGPSPEPLRQRLAALEQASINNIVDATNAVMLETGQPLHAFDFDRLAERRIVVRRARAGEKMRTLDGIERALSAEMCVIADASRAVAIAGIMGGAESEIGPTTRNVLLESAWFDPISIRRASKALGLRTEASLRFERGADPEMAETASRKCAAMIRALAGGEILAGVVGVYPARREPLRLRLSRQELLRVMGADVPNAEIEAILRALGFGPTLVESGRSHPDSHSAGTAAAWDLRLSREELLRLGGDAPEAVIETIRRVFDLMLVTSPSATWECHQPSWRQDVTREVDLVEEVARHYGLDKFPARLQPSKQPAARLPHAEAEDRLRERLIGLGYNEIVNIPLVNEAEDALFRAAGTTPARVTNPLAEDASLLRSNGLISMAHALAWNINHGQRSVRLFEIGRAYTWDGSATREHAILTMGATGLARDKGVSEAAREYEFADLKGDLDQLGALAGGFSWIASPRPTWQHAAHAGDFALAGKGDQRQAMGTAAKVARSVAERFKFRQDVFLAELFLAPFYHGFIAARAARRYQPVSRFPAVERDFSLTLDDGTTFAAVRETIASLAIPELVSVEAVDLFRGKHVPAGKFSLLVRATFQSHAATLTEAQVNEFSGRIVAALEKKLGASLRAS